MRVVRTGRGSACGFWSFSEWDCLGLECSEGSSEEFQEHNGKGGRSKMEDQREDGVDASGEKATERNGEAVRKQAETSGKEIVGTRTRGIHTYAYPT